MGIVTSSVIIETTNNLSDSMLFLLNVEGSESNPVVRGLDALWFDTRVQPGFAAPSEDISFFTVRHLLQLPPDEVQVALFHHNMASKLAVGARLENVACHAGERK